MADEKRLQHTAEEIDANLSEVHNSKGSCSCLSERLASMDTNIAAKANVSDLAAKANASDVAALETQITTPFNFKGTVASASDLPSTAELNDTYFVTELNYRVTWNGIEFTQSSLDEGEYEDELSEVSDNVDAVKADLAVFTDKNLCGMSTEVYYPVNIPAGTNLTFSTEGGVQNPITNRLLLFDENKTQKDYFTFTEGDTTKTITTSSSRGTTKYIRWQNPSAVNYQVELGETATSFQRYRGIKENLYSLIDNKPKYDYTVDAIANENIIRSRNLISNVANEFCPCNIASGTKITVSTSDGSALPVEAQKECTLYFYDENHSVLDYYGIFSAYGVNYRTITTNFSSGRVAKYVAINNQSSVPLMAVIGTDVIPYEPYHHSISEVVSELQSLPSNYSAKNLCGMRDDVLYIVDIPAGGKFTMSRADGESQETESIIELYDENKVKTDYWSLRVGESSRTIITNSSKNATKYLKWSADYSAKPIQVELGAIATEYEEYRTFGKQLEAVVNTVYDMSKGYNDVQPYYVDEIATTIEDSIDAMTEPCIVFALITDIHYSSLGAPQILDYTVQNMIAVNEKVKFDFVLCLGDVYDRESTAAAAMSKADYVRNALSKVGVPLYSAIGNHDTNGEGQEQLSLSQVFRTFCSPARNSKPNFAANGTDYYVDFDGIGIRLVVLNSQNPIRYAYSTDTANWFEEVALATENAVVLAEHMSPIGTQNWSGTTPTNGNQVATAIQTFISDGGKLVHLFGHSHIDYSFDSPFTSICNNCNKFEVADITDSGYQAISGYDDSGLVANEREERTASEDCWSVVIVKPNSGTINLIRFGAGDDREFTF